MDFRKLLQKKFHIDCATGQEICQIDLYGKDLTRRKLRPHFLGAVVNSGRKQFMQRFVTGQVVEGDAGGGGEG